LRSNVPGTFEDESGRAEEGTVLIVVTDDGV